MTGRETTLEPSRARSDTPKAAGLDVVGLFAGVGGLELGLARSGHSTRALCEIDPAALSIIREHFPGVPVHGDVQTFRMPDNIGILAAGFPCTDLSQVGRRRGITGEASGLIIDVLDKIERKRRRRRPAWILLENVPFLLQLDRGSGIRYLTDRLAYLGYRWAYRVVDTRAFGIPQRRRRVFLLAGLDGDPVPVLFTDVSEDADDPTSDSPPVGFYWTEGNTGIGWAPGAVPTLKGGSGWSIPSPPAIWLPERIVTPNIGDAERLQGLKPGWTEPAADMIGSHRARWKLVGNAVSVPVAEWIGRRLLDPGEVVDEDLGGRQTRRWPDSAYGDSNGAAPYVKAVVASDFPYRLPLPTVTSFLKFEPLDLSARATTGFMTRLVDSRLRQRKLKPFLRALAKHALQEGAARHDIPTAALDA